MFQNNWQKIKLADYTTTFSGLSGKTKDDFGSGEKYIPYLNVFNNSIIDDHFFGLVKINQNENQNEVIYGDLIFTTSSETPLEVGMCSVYLNKKEHVFLNSFCFGIRLTNVGVLDPLFLSFYFRSSIGRKLIYKLSQGATRYNLSKSGLLKSEILVPTFAQQQEIVKILKSYDDSINILKQIIENTKLKNRSLSKNLLSGISRIKTFTQNWHYSSLDDCLTLNQRPTNKPAEKFLSIGIRSHGKGIFHKPNFNPSDIAMEELYEVKEDDLIVNITFAWEQAIAIVSKEDDGGLVSHRFPTYIFKKEKAIPEFFRHFILQPRFKYLLELISPGGAGRNRVMSKKDFLKLEVKIPSVEEQKAIAEVLDTANLELKLYEEKLRLLQEQKKGLLQQLLTGKTRVILR